MQKGMAELGILTRSVNLALVISNALAGATLSFAGMSGIGPTNQIGAAPILALALPCRADREPKPIAPLCDLAPVVNGWGHFLLILFEESIIE